MKNFGVIAKEVAICLVLLVVALGINAFLFKDIYFTTIEVPEANKYTVINRDLYKVVGDIQDAQNATQTYEASSSQIDDYLTEHRYTPGTINPFVSSSNGNDLPSEVVKKRVESEQKQSEKVEENQITEDKNEEVEETAN